MADYLEVLPTQKLVSEPMTIDMFPLKRSKKGYLAVSAAERNAAPRSAMTLLLLPRNYKVY